MRATPWELHAFLIRFCYGFWIVNLRSCVRERLLLQFLQIADIRLITDYWLLITDYWSHNYSLVHQ